MAGLPYSRSRKGDRGRAIALLLWGAGLTGVPLATFISHWGFLMPSELVFLSFFVLPGVWAVFVGLHRLLFREEITLDAGRVRRRSRRLWTWHDLDQPYSAYLGVAAMHSGSRPRRGPALCSILLVHREDPALDVELAQMAEGPALFAETEAWSELLGLDVTVLAPERASAARGAHAQEGGLGRTPMQGAALISAGVLVGGYLLSTWPILRVLGAVLGFVGLLLGDPLILWAVFR